LNIVIPMAGNGSRFPKEKYLPKPLIDVHGKPMICRALESLNLDGTYHFVIRLDEYTEVVKDLISNYVNSCTFIEVDKTTEGPACSALLFEDQIDNDEELVIANCDQIMEWNSYLFLLNARQFDGCVVTYYSTTDKNSYIRIDKQGLGLELREKVVISNIGLNGIHYWKHGTYFVNSSKKMIVANDRAPNGEFYIAPTYNYMINAGQQVGIYHIPNEQHHAVGTPEDLDIYLNK
jgi:NDP-sugar pyrophosphorylase family protein